MEGLSEGDKDADGLTEAESDGLSDAEGDAEGENEADGPSADAPLMAMPATAQVAP